MAVSRTVAKKTTKAAAGTARAGVTLDMFVWEGTDKRGVKMKGEQQAKSANLVRAELRRQGINPTVVKTKPKPLFGGAGKPITPKEIEEYYKDNPDDFRRPATAKVKYVVIDRAPTSADTAPTVSAARIPATTSSGRMVRCSKSTSMSALVPAVSPSTLRAACQNASCAAVNTPDARARANAVEPGRAPGLRCRTSR